MDSLHSPIAPLPMTPVTPNDAFTPSKRPRTYTHANPFTPPPSLTDFHSSPTITPHSHSSHARHFPPLLSNSQQQQLHHQQQSQNTLPSIHDALAAHSFNPTPWNTMDSSPPSPTTSDCWPTTFDLAVRTQLPPPVQIFDMVHSPIPSPFAKDTEHAMNSVSMPVATSAKMVSLKDLAVSSPLASNPNKLLSPLPQPLKSMRPIELAGLAKVAAKPQPENRGIKRASVPEPLCLADIARSFPTNYADSAITPSSGNRTLTPQIRGQTPSTTTPISLDRLNMQTPSKTPLSAQSSMSVNSPFSRTSMSQATAGMLSLSNLTSQPSSIHLSARKAQTQPPTPTSTSAMPSFRLSDLISSTASATPNQDSKTAECLVTQSQPKVCMSLSMFPQHSSDPSIILQKSASSFTIRPDINLDDAIERVNQMSRPITTPPFPFTRSRSAPSPSDLLAPPSRALFLPNPSQPENKPLDHRDLDRILELSATPSILEESDPPPSITLAMHPYQTQGLAWLIRREKNERQEENFQANKEQIITLDSLRQGPITGSVYYPRGGILADEQGLGKTVQMISLILANPGLSSSDYLNSGLMPCKSTLVVCPLTMVHQWEAEIRNVTKPGSLSVYIYHGSSRVKNHTHLANFDIVITTYNILVSDLAEEMDHHGKLNSEAVSKLNWYRIILDESHVIKDHTTRSARAVCCLSADIRWCLTGTPVQNKIDDLYSLLKFLKVDPYGRYDYWNQYVMKPQRASGAIDFKQFQIILRPILLRRTKDQKIGEKDIVKMAPKIIQVRALRFQEHEAQIYRSLWADSQNSYKKLVETNMIFKNYSVILDLLLRLRQACDHPSLCYSRSNQPQILSSFSPVPQVYDETLSEKASTDDSKLNQTSEDKCVSCCELIECGYLTSCSHMFCVECFNTVTDDVCPHCESTFAGVKSVQSRAKITDRVGLVGNYPSTSTKIQALMKELHLTWSEDPTTKAIVFSQWTGMLDLIEAEMIRSNILFERLDGRMVSSHRDAAIRNFKTKENIRVILISLKAGGVGLNLAEASRVFVMDPWWNPATEEQAIDRAHRVNQTRPVIVTRFIIENTIEEKILQLQKLKSMMARGALGNRETDSQLKMEQLRLLFSEPSEKLTNANTTNRSPSRY